MNDDTEISSYYKVIFYMKLYKNDCKVVDYK